MMGNVSALNSNIFMIRSIRRYIQHEEKNSSLAFPVLVDILASKNARETRFATAHLITQGSDSI